MATLEDAAEELVVKLRGLDSEMEESGRALADLKAKVEDVTDEVEQEWTALTDAASSLLGAVREEQERVHRQAEETLHALTDAQNTVAQDGAEARGEVDGGRAQLEALGEHATGLEPNVESLAADAGEAPAHNLVQQARELAQELERAVDEARDYLRDVVVPAVEGLADDVRTACQDLHHALAEESTAALQKSYDDWQSRVGELEEYVAAQGFRASCQHAHDVADYALAQCRTASEHQLDELQPLLGLVTQQLQDLAAEVQRSTDALVAKAGADLTSELQCAAQAATGALSALDSVRTLLSSYSFVGI